MQKKIKNWRLKNDNMYLLGLVLDLIEKSDFGFNILHLIQIFIYYCFQ